MVVFESYSKVKKYLKKEGETSPLCPHVRVLTEEIKYLYRSRSKYSKEEIKKLWSGNRYCLKGRESDPLCRIHPQEIVINKQNKLELICQAKQKLIFNPEKIEEQSPV